VAGGRGCGGVLHPLLRPRGSGEHPLEQSAADSCQNAADSCQTTGILLFLTLYVLVNVLHVLYVLHANFSLYLLYVL